MRLFSLVVSIITLFSTAFFLIADFPDITTFNGVVYFSLMVILILICITGIIINLPIVNRIHNTFKVKIN